MATILLVDDDVSILEVTTAILEHSGYTVICVHNGQEALEYLGKGELPHLILSDTMMPMMDGRELCRRLQVDPSLSSIPFILVSGGTGAPSPHTCNYTAFVAKPFSVDVLLSTVELALREQQAES